MFLDESKEFLVKMNLDEYKQYSAIASKDHLGKMTLDSKTGNFIIRMSFEEYGQYDKKQV